MRTAMISLIVALTIASIGTAFAYKGEKYASLAKITLKNAEDIALKAVPGKIKDEELEKEKGGSGLRYSFDILYQGKIHEVGVDAKTGDVLENSLPGPNAD
ncbi:MAG: PepSY domain-containing protein [Gammaproteobacteria bacterium]